jgi:CCR4-NOT transcription complex subunit 2
MHIREFPSLSNNQSQQATSVSQSTWAMPSARSLGQAANQRSQQQQLLSSQQHSQVQQQTQQQQEDLFSSSSQLSNSQAGFRFGGQTAVGQSQASPVDDFPPLSRNLNGEIGQDRGMSLLTNVSFSAQPSGSVFGSGLGSQGVQNNGLLNALSGSIRAPLGTGRVTSPTVLGGTGKISGSLLTANNTLGLSAARSGADPGRQGVGSNFDSESNVTSTQFHI